MPSPEIETNPSELAAWKRTFRVLHHEINNSLSPVLSLARSGRLLLKRPESEERLDALLATIAERAEHLAVFLDGYATLARVPSPRRKRVVWDELLGGLAALVPFRYVLSSEDVASDIDRGQVEQLLINLLRNAAEASGHRDETVVHVEGERGGVRIFVRDRGPGMESDTIDRAHLPFFSTKAGGTGLGLALAREIAQGHDGEMTLRNRVDGGLEIEIWLPSRGEER